MATKKREGRCKAPLLPAPVHLTCLGLPARAPKTRRRDAKPRPHRRHLVHGPTLANSELQPLSSTWCKRERALHSERTSIRVKLAESASERARVSVAAPSLGVEAHTELHRHSGRHHWRNRIETSRLHTRRQRFGSLGEVGNSATHGEDELTPGNSKRNQTPNTLLETPAAEDNPCVPLPEN